MVVQKLAVGSSVLNLSFIVAMTLTQKACSDTGLQSFLPAFLCVTEVKYCHSICVPWNYVFQKGIHSE